MAALLRSARFTRTARLAPLGVAVILAAGLAAAGDPKTPLGKWMQPNIGTPLASQDFTTLQQNLTIVAKNPPPSGNYGNWASIAQAGATAASNQDLKSTKASCKQCHDQYKQQYIADFPTRPFPPPGP
jgi:hypothetical protein